MLQDNTKGVNVFIIGAFINDFPFNLIAGKGMNSAQDLKGKQIEVVGNGGEIDERQIRTYLRKNGLYSGKDVIWVRNAPSPAIHKILERIESDKIHARAVWIDDPPIIREMVHSILCDFFAVLYL